MHAMIFLLADLDRTEAKGSIFGQAEDAINYYAADYCDEDNWWTIDNVVLADDRQVASDGRLCLIGGTWSFARLDAMLTIAWNFGPMLDNAHSEHWTKRLKQTPKERGHLISAVHVTIPLYIRHNNAWAASARAAPTDKQFSYRRRQLDRAYELFSLSMSPDRAPFSSWLAEPYDYRAFDLSDEASPNAIIRVDIHT